MSRPLLVVVVVSLAMAGLDIALAGPFANVGPLVQVSGTSPFVGCTVDEIADQSGTLTLHSEVEPWIDANPANPSNLAGSWQQDRWSNGGARGLVAGVSLDGGTSWQSIVIPNVSLCSGGTTANGGDYQRATDPWLSFAPNGDLYHASLSFDENSPDNAILVSKSTDGGLSWSDPVTILKDTSFTFFNDKESITADATDADFAYVTWDRLIIPSGGRPDHVGKLGFRGPLYFSRTTNGGASWEPARSIYDAGGANQVIGAQIVVLPDGRLVNFFNEILFSNIGSGTKFDFNLSLIRSTDKGATWRPRRAIRAAKMQPRALFASFISVYDPESGAPVRTEDLLPEVAVDPRPGQTTLYAVWQDARFSNNGNFANPNLIIDEVAFAASTDGGLTWSVPVKINKTPLAIPLGNRQAFTPSVHVSSDGVMAVTYYDFRNNTTAQPLLTDHWVIHCHASCTNSANWTDEIRLTTTSFDMRRAPFAGGFFVGDYVGLTSVGSAFLSFFGQTTPTDPGNIVFRRVGP